MDIDNDDIKKKHEEWKVKLESFTMMMKATEQVTRSGMYTDDEVEKERYEELKADFVPLAMLMQENAEGDGGERKFEELKAEVEPFILNLEAVISRYEEEVPVAEFMERNPP